MFLPRQLVRYHLEFKLNSTGIVNVGSVVDLEGCIIEQIINV